MTADRDPDEDDEDEGAGPVPDAARYITPAGLARFRSQYNELRLGERPRIVEIVSWAAGNGDRSENGDYQYGKRRLREIDRRLRFLDRRLRRAIVVDPASQTRRDRVFFGATVTYVDESDRERTVTILGADEADTGRAEVSLLSPVARALLGAAVGEERVLRTPSGPETLEILRIAYPPPAAGD